MASFGSYAGHERRGSELVPMRSAILGLVGAALGIDRKNAESQVDLRTYSVAVQPFQRSKPLRDYHTIQTVPTAKAKRPATRRHALENAGRDINTVITFRDYQCDVLIGVVLWGQGRWPLDDLVNHLRRPKFPLYLGRKSCPLASPLNANVVKAKDPVDAMTHIEIPKWLRSTKWSEQDRMQHPVYSDPVDDLDNPPLSEQVPGEPLDRQAWTFGECTVWHLGGRRSERGDGGKA